MKYTLKQLVYLLTERGHRRDWAELEAAKDLEAMNNQANEPKKYDCSVCRGEFTDLQWKYHFHPCE